MCFTSNRFGPKCILQSLHNSIYFFIKQYDFTRDLYLINCLDTIWNDWIYNKKKHMNFKNIYTKLFSCFQSLTVTISDSLKLFFFSDTFLIVYQPLPKLDSKFKQATMSCRNYQFTCSIIYAHEKSEWVIGHDPTSIIYYYSIFSVRRPL